MDTYRQVFGNNRATTGACLRSASWVNQRHPSTSVFSFVGGELHELTPSHVRNAPADRLRPMGTRVDLHLLNVEFFKSNELIFIHQFTRFLVCEVVAPIRRTLVGMTQGVNNLAPLGATFGKLLFLALQSGNVVGILLHPTLAFDLVTITEVGKGGQTQVNTDNVMIGWQWLWLTFTGETSVPVANRITLNGQGLNVSTDRTVQFDPHVTNLRKCQSVAVQLETRLLEGERVIAAIALKAGIARSFTSLDTTKESFESQLHALLNVLQNLGMNFFQRWLFGFPLREKLIRIVQAQRLSCLLIGVLANCQRIVVDAAACLKHSIKPCPLGVCWEKTVLKC